MRRHALVASAPRRVRARTSRADITAPCAARVSSCACHRRDTTQNAYHPSHSTCVRCSTHDTVGLCVARACAAIIGYALFIAERATCTRKTARTPRNACACACMRVAASAKQSNTLAYATSTGFSTVSVNSAWTRWRTAVSTRASSTRPGLLCEPTVSESRMRVGMRDASRRTDRSSGLIA